MSPVSQISDYYHLYLIIADYREAFCYFQEAKLFDYIFLKTCAVMCAVIQLFY